MSDKKQLPAATIIVASVLIIFNRVMLSSVTIPMTGSSKYVIYTSMLAVSIIGASLIPIYMGFHAEKFQQRNTLFDLGKMYVIYIVISLLSIIFNFIVFDVTTIKYLWDFLFPISQNAQPYATAIVLIYLVGPIMIRFFDRLEPVKLKQLFIIASILAVFLPTLFGKDIWALQAGGQILFDGYLVLLGYYMQRINLLNHKYKLLKLLTSGLIYLVMTLVMGAISNSLYNDYSTINRFNVPFSIFALFLAIYLFDTLENSNIKFKLSFNQITVFLISTVMITTQPVNINSIANFMKVSEQLAPFNWLLMIVKNIVILAIPIIVLSYLILSLLNNQRIKRLIYKVSPKSINDAFTKLNQTWQYLWRHKHIVLVFASFYFMTALQKEIITYVVLKTNLLRNLLNCFFAGQPAIVLTSLILMACFFILYLVFNRFWYAYGIMFVTELIITVASTLKIILRHEPILPTDMSSLTSTGDILKMISPVVVVAGFLAIIISFILFIWLQHKDARTIKMAIKLRIINILVLMILLSGTFFVNHANLLPARICNIFKIQKMFYDQEDGARVNGPILQFINNLDVSVMDKPEGYSKAAVQKVMKKYDQEAKNINVSRQKWAKNQTFIYILNESFSDPNRVPNLKVAGNPIPNVMALKKETTSGLMMSSGYGGGTANMEWQSLTGLNLSLLSPTLTTPYSQLVSSIDTNPNITNLFDQKVAIHPYNASLYNRKDVFKRFGFQQFYYEGSSKNKLKYTDKVPASSFISDESAFKETERLITKNNQKSQFIQLSTMQNHLPYSSSDGSMALPISGTAIGDNGDAINNYVERIRYTDKAVKEFIDTIDQSKRPITVVWYGDHLPGIYFGDSMTKYGIQLHQTDYFIYNNKAGAKNITTQQIVSPYSFSSMAMAQANIKVTPYYALLTKLTDKVPASIPNPYTSGDDIDGSQVFVLNNGKTEQKSELSKTEKRTLHDYELIQYDIVAGKQYSAKWATQKAK